jgi:hypothetical protein
MSKGIRYNGDYSITAADATGNLIVTVDTMTIHGNLNVIGNVSEITSNNSAVSDNFITLNAGETAAGVTLGTAGIDVDRGSLARTAIRWNENRPTGPARWELTNDGTTWGGISTITSSGASFALIDDLNPQLGANLDVLGRTIFSSNNEVVVFGMSAGNLVPAGTYGSGIAIQNTPIVPSAMADHTVIYSQDPQNGNTGLYVTTNPANPVQEELITKAKAIAYALIFR